MTNENKLVTTGRTTWDEADADPLADLEAAMNPLRCGKTEERLRRIAIEKGDNLFLISGSDYSKIEMHILTSLGYERVLLDIDSPGGQLDGFLDIKAEPRLKEKPLKQNGRSAEYLKHNRIRKRR